MKFWVEAVLRSIAVMFLGAMLCAPGRWGETTGGGGGGPGGSSIYTRQTVLANLTSAVTGGPGLHTALLDFPLLAGVKYNIVCSFNVMNNSDTASTAAQFQWALTPPPPTTVLTRFNTTHSFCSGANTTPSNFLTSISVHTVPADDTNSVGPGIGLTCQERITFSIWTGGTDAVLNLAFQSDADTKEVVILAGSYCEQAVVP